MWLYIGYQTTAVLYGNLLPPASNSPFITLLLLSCASFIRWVTSPMIHLVWGWGRDPSCLICRQKKKKCWIHQSSKKTFNLVICLQDRNGFFRFGEILNRPMFQLYRSSSQQKRSEKCRCFNVLLQVADSQELLLLESD